MIDNKDFLLEIGTEELPFSAQKVVINEAKNIFENLLKSEKIEYKDLNVFVTPCRIVVFIKNLTLFQKSEEKEILGPPKKIAYSDTGEITRALTVFLEKNNAKIEDIVEKETPKGIYLSILSKTDSKNIKEFLPNICLEFAKKLPFAKMMTWNSTNFKFIRPIRWVLSILGEEFLPCNIAGIDSGENTFLIGGYKSQKVEVKNVQNYFEIIKTEGIIIDYSERKKYIQNQMLSNILGYKLFSEDNDLFEEVTALVEYPTIVLCDFDKKFLSLPFEVIYTVLKNHQKCFALIDDNNNLVSKFVAVCNGKNRNLEVVKAGYEKVAVARLNDAVFFYESDKKIDFKDRTEKLKNLIYQEKLGSVYEKIERIEKIAKFICDTRNFFNTEYDRKNNFTFGQGIHFPTISSIINLCKNDLLTDMVGEFPELQGIMGKYYALSSGENEVVVNAIEEHYLPRFAGDKLPKSLEGAIVSIADKIDNILSTFLLDKKPTGSKDPFGIRRQINGIFNILKDTKCSMDLYELVDKSLDIFSDKFNNDEINKAKLELREFLNTRIENWLIESGFRIDIVRAVNFDSKILNGFDLFSKCLDIKSYLEKEEFKKFIGLYKRANNILKQAKDKNIDFENWKLKYELFIIEEKNLFDDISTFNIYDVNSWNTHIIKLKISLDEFFDKIMVMAEDENLKKNRLAILNCLIQKFNGMADFSELNID